MKRFTYLLYRGLVYFSHSKGGGTFMTKLRPALYVSLLISGLFFIAGLFGGGFLFSFLVFMYAVAGNFIYGIPVSLLSDFLTRNLSNGRIFVAGIIHIFFGFIILIIIDEYAYFAIIDAILFFLIDEWLRNRRIGRGNGEKRTLVLEIFSVIPFVALAIWGISILTIEEKTNMVYLIPEDYEGSVVAFYNITGEDLLEKEGDFNIVPLSIESLPTLQNTNIERYGIHQTSKEMSNGIVNNQYFYVDKEGNRTLINDYCIYEGVYGSYTGTSEHEIGYHTFQVTNSECGEDFFLHGNEHYTAQSSEILKYWTSLYD